MPWTYTRDDSRRRVTVTLSDPVTLTELKASVTRQAEDNAWTYPVLLDARMQAHPLITAEVETLVDYVQQLSLRHGPRGPVAIVATTSVTFGVARMHAALAEDSQVRIGIFYDLESAELWLAERERSEP